MKNKAMQRQLTEDLCDYAWVYELCLCVKSLHLALF